MNVKTHDDTQLSLRLRLHVLDLSSAMHHAVVGDDKLAVFSHDDL